MAGSPQFQEQGQTPQQAAMDALGGGQASAPQAAPPVDSSMEGSPEFRSGETPTGPASTPGAPSPVAVTQQAAVHHMNKGDIAKSVVFAALAGALKGLGVAPGPGSMGRAASAGFQGVQDMQQQARENEQQRQNQAYMQKARGLDLNLKQLQLQKQIADMDEETHAKNVDLYAKQLSDAIEDNPGAVKGTHVSERDAADIDKYGSHPLRIPDGYVPKPGGGFEQTFTIMDGDTQVPVSEWADAAKEWHIPGADKLQEGNVSMLTSGHYTHAVASLEATQSELNQEAQMFGTKPSDLKAEMEKNPGLLAAILQFQKSSWASTHPDEQISAMKQDKNAAPYAPYIEQLFGGKQNLNNMATLRNMDDKQAQQISDAPAGQYPKPLVDAANTRVKKQQDRVTQQKQQDSDIALEREKNIADYKKKHGGEGPTDADIRAANGEVGKHFKTYSDTRTQANHILSALDMSRDGNQVASALAPLESTLFITSSAGVRRVNELELNMNAPGAGSAVRRVNAWYEKNKSGALPTDYIKDLKAIVTAYSAENEQNYRDNVDSVNQRYNTKINYGALPNRQQGNTSGGGNGFFGAGTIPAK